MVVLTGCSAFDVGGADYGRAGEPPLGVAHQPATAQPPGAAGLARGTLSPGWERETDPRELESHERRSLELEALQLERFSHRYLCESLKVGALNADREEH